MTGCGEKQMWRRRGGFLYLEREAWGSDRKGGGGRGARSEEGGSTKLMCRVGNLWAE